MQFIINQDDKKIFQKIFILFIELIFFYVRNIFFIISAFCIFALLIIVYIFYQDVLKINIIPEIILFFQGIPVLGQFIRITDQTISLDGNDLKNFLFKLSFYFTLLTTLIHYIRKHIFKKNIDEVKNLKKRIKIILISITLAYIFSLIYLLPSFREEDNITFFIIFWVIKWIVCSISSLMFVVLDVASKKISTFFKQT
jgi:hypothetical protein